MLQEYCQKSKILNKLIINNLHNFANFQKRETADNERVSQRSTVFRMGKNGTLEHLRGGRRKG